MVQNKGRIKMSEYDIIEQKYRKFLNMKSIDGEEHTFRDYFYAGWLMCMLWEADQEIIENRELQENYEPPRKKRPKNVTWRELTDLPYIKEGDYPT